MEEEVRSLRWQDWLNLVLGVWLAVMPFVGVIPLESAVALNGFFFGVIIAAISVAALVWELRWEEWVNVAIGLWLVVAPFILGATHSGVVMWSSLIIGLFIAGDALWAALTSRSTKPVPPSSHEA